MVGRQGIEKRRAREVRFERFRASGLPVGRPLLRKKTSVGGYVLILGEACRIELGHA
jgi:hypothetical protein